MGSPTATVGLGVGVRKEAPPAPEIPGQRIEIIRGAGLRMNLPRR